MVSEEELQKRNEGFDAWWSEWERGYSAAATTQERAMSKHAAIAAWAASSSRLRGAIAEIERKLDGCVSDRPEMPLSQAMAHALLDIRAIIEREES